jgi:poly(A) polymerase
VKRLRAAGHTAYFAGGCVRDMLRGVEPNDYDVATSARPEEVRKLFPHTVAVGAQFGVILVLEDGQRFEVATFRSDAAYVDGRRPSGVTFSSPEQDARRRDFTVNGLFYDPIEERVIDFVGGRSDIERRLIRAIGEPCQRFEEDKLRMLRCVRCASTLGFEIERQTFAAVRSMAPQIKVVSAERIRDELIKMWTGPNGGRGLRLLDESGLLHEILPEIETMKGVAQPPQFHPEGDVFVHTCLMMDAVSATIEENQKAKGKRQSVEADEAQEGAEESAERFDVVLAFAALLHDVGKPPTFELTREADGSERIRFNNHDAVGAEMTERILRRLKFPNDVARAVVECVANHMRFKDAPKMRTGKVKQLLARPTFAVELELHRIDCEASHRNLDNYVFLKQKAAETSEEEIRPQPLLTGNDLLAMGFPQGPLIGTILKEVSELQLEEKLRTAEDARRWVEKTHPEIKNAEAGEKGTRDVSGPR